jgi:hypothetical protein
MGRKESRDREKKGQEDRARGRRCRRKSGHGEQEQLMVNKARPWV